MKKVIATPPPYRPSPVITKTHNLSTERIPISMNGMFSVVFLCAAIAFILSDPNGFLPAVIEGGQRAATLCISLLGGYCLWMGFFRVLEASGISKKIANLFRPACKKLFRTDDREAVYLVAGNLTANMLGLPGAPTPLGIRATEKFTAQKNYYARSMLFVLNATSLQLLPTTVLAVRIAFGSAAPADIVLPTLIVTAVSALLGVLLVRIFIKK